MLSDTLYNNIRHSAYDFVVAKRKESPSYFDCKTICLLPYWRKSELLKGVDIFMYIQSSEDETIIDGFIKILYWNKAYIEIRIIPC